MPITLHDHPTNTDLPPDPDGKNDERANWALNALNEFIRCTGPDEEDALCDLLCDLMHLADRREDHMPDFEAVLRRARYHYEAETSETEE
jgi:hypothetical protein